MSKINGMEELTRKMQIQALRLIDEAASSETHGQQEGVSNNAYYKNLHETVRLVHALARVRDGLAKQCKADGRVYKDKGGMWDVSHCPKIGEEETQSAEQEDSLGLEERIKKMEALIASSKETNHPTNVDLFTYQTETTTQQPKRNGLLSKVFGN